MTITFVPYHLFGQINPVLKSGNVTVGCTLTKFMVIVHVRVLWRFKIGDEGWGLRGVESMLSRLSRLVPASPRESGQWPSGWAGG